MLLSETLHFRIIFKIIILYVKSEINLIIKLVIIIVVNVFNQHFQQNAIKLIDQYNVISPVIISKNLHISLTEAKKLIDSLFIQGYLNYHSPSKVTSNNCNKGCKGCPLSSSCSDKVINKNFSLTDRALKLINKI